MKVKTVYLWSNGNVVVLGVNGEQIAELQKNNIFDLRSVKEASDKDTRFYFGEWKQGQILFPWGEWRQMRIELNVTWIFDKDVAKT